MEKLSAEFEEIPFEEYVHTESAIKERTLQRIRNAARERSFSNLGNSVHSQEGDDEEDDDDEENVPDVRTELFESIPEPYYNNSEFRRVVITDIADSAVDSDTKEACKLLKKSIELREKWMAQYPAPPQDLVTSFKDDELFSPKPTNSRKAINPDGFRRRSVPKYEVFDASLPVKSCNLRYKMVHGVVMVYEVAQDGCAINMPSASEKLSYSRSEDDLVKEGIAEKAESQGEEEGEADMTVGLSLSRSMEEFDIANHTATTTDLKPLFTVFSYEEFVKDFQAVSLFDVCYILVLWFYLFGWMV